MPTLTEKFNELKRELTRAIYLTDNKRYTLEVFFKLYKQEDYILENFIAVQLKQQWIIDQNGYLTEKGKEELFSWWW